MRILRAKGCSFVDAISGLTEEDRWHFLIRYALAKLDADMIYDLTELIEAMLETVVYPAIDEEVRATRLKIDDRVWERIKANCRKLAKAKRVVVEIRDR
mgnify:FL=1